MADFVPNDRAAVLYSLTYVQSEKKVFVDYLSDNFSDVVKCDEEKFREYLEFAQTVVVDRREFLCIFCETSSAGNSFLREYRIRVQTGGYQKLIDYCHANAMENGNISYSGIIVNCTEHEISDTALRISEDRLRLALEASGAGFFDWIHGSKSIFCDATTLNLCGIANFDVTVKKFLRVVDRKCLRECFDVFRDILSGDCTFFKVEVNLRESSNCWLCISGKIVATDQVNGRPLRIAGTVRDVTESKQVIIERERMNEILEERIRERTAQLEQELATKLAAERQLIENLKRERELNNVKSVFVNMVSHEFRTPLAIIQGAVDLMGKYYEKLSDAERMSCLGSVSKAVQRMTRTMDDILVLGKVQTDQLKFTPAETDILANCHGILNDIEGFQAKKRIIFEISRNVPLKLKIDSDLLYHIASNLLSNALKYSPDDKPVIFNLDYANGNLEIFVEDFGIGIPEQDRTNIFKIFHRGSNVSNRQGIGVGMFIVKYCVNLHGGSIEMASKKGDGTIFRIKLPAPVL
jgi:signal transduction histidine kinase